MKKNRDNRYWVHYVKEAEKNGYLVETRFGGAVLLCSRGKPWLAENVTAVFFGRSISRRPKDDFDGYSKRQLIWMRRFKEMGLHVTRIRPPTKQEG